MTETGKVFLRYLYKRFGWKVIHHRKKLFRIIHKRAFETSMKKLKFVIFTNAPCKGLNSNLHINPFSIRPEGSAPTIFIKISGISHIFIYISFHHSKISYHFCPQIYDRSDTTLQYQTKIAFHYQDVSANFWCQLIATLSSLVISLSILDISLTWLYASIVTSMWACPIIY